MGPVVIWKMPGRRLKAHEELEFDILDGVFAFEAGPFVGAFEAQLARSQAIGDSQSLWEDFLEGVKAELESVDSTEAHTIDRRDVPEIWILMRSVIANLSFLNLYCPSCNQRFSPKEIESVIWEQGSGFSALGGRRLECPRGHILYAVVTWNS